MLVLDKELAITGYLYNVALDIGLSEEIQISPDDVFNYCAYLSRADVGFILKTFNHETLIRYFNSKNDLFNKISRKNYIFINGYFRFYTNMKEYRDFLIDIFKPDLNYNEHFLKFIFKY